MDINEIISSSARNAMIKAIGEAEGNEIFFRGIPNEDGIVEDVVVLARGNKHSVPAIMNKMKRREVIIHNHPSGHLYPSDPDVAIASMYANQKSGASYIINNDLTDIYVIVELTPEENVAIDIKPYFERKGMLSQAFPEFEYRDEQLQMASVIEKGLNEGKKVIVEAGTGTGKTLAYLLPSIEWAIQNQKKVVISTNTINLQEQLLNKDIPIAKRVIQGDFNYLLVKGRGNYLCNRKVMNMASGETVDFEEFTQSQKEQFQAILRWSAKTKKGDKGELPFEVDNFVWEFFHSESDMCSGPKCPYKGECFFLKSREEKKQADILITNHHMYFADLSIRKETGFNTEYAILPDYDLVVFDEAHNIEKVARDYFSYESSKYSFTKTMNQIYNTGKKKKKLGSYQLLLNYLKNIKFDNYKEVERLIATDLTERHIDLQKRGGDYFMMLIDAFSRGQKGNVSARLRPEELEHAPFWPDLKEAEEELLLTYNSYMKKVRSLVRVVKEADDESGIINDFTKYIDRLEAFFMNFKFIQEMDDNNFIYWVSVNGVKNNAKLVATPLKINDELDKSLYINLDHIVFTSATIAIGDDFNYFKESIGLTEETLEKVIHSPFDYDRQMRVYIPSDVPLPNDKNFTYEIKDFIKELVRRAKGNTFILFTSYSSLNYMYYMIKDELEEEGYDLFIQGMAPRNQIVNMYKMSKKPVLFGTDSFWEGVDVKGEKLSSVILVKLPFKVPSDPVVEAIIENLNAEGKNAFLEYQIPESIIKFKQGIGRLIRSKDDRGIITILDTRTIKKRYGKLFLDAIPTKNILVKTKNDILYK